MDPKNLTAIAAATLALVIGSVAGIGLAGGGVALAACAAPPTSTGPAVAAAAAPSLWPPVGAWSGDQVANAATIVAVGQQFGVPVRGWVMAVATAMQESRLRNLPGGDGDSLGLFQQRPSQGWGDTPASPSDHRTPSQRILDPAYAATRFYQALSRVPGWQNLPLTVAAQAVQRSTFPDAYATWEADALTIVNAVGSALAGIPTAQYTQWASTCVALGGDGQPVGDAVLLPPGFTLPAVTPAPARAAVMWALAQLGTPYSYGGDCTAPHSGIPAHQCDCSSLTQMAWQAAGVHLPRTAAEQAHTGTPVPSPALLQPGDLIFIPGADGTPTAPGHVGLYLGQGLIIEAPHSGDYVKVVQFPEWLPEISQMRRPGGQ